MRELCRYPTETNPTTTSMLPIVFVFIVVTCTGAIAATLMKLLNRVRTPVTSRYTHKTVGENSSQEARCVADNEQINKNVRRTSFWVNRHDGHAQAQDFGPLGSENHDRPDWWADNNNAQAFDADQPSLGASLVFVGASLATFAFWLFATSLALTPYATWCTPTETNDPCWNYTQTSTVGDALISALPQLIVITLLTSALFTAFIIFTFKPAQRPRKVFGMSTMSASFMTLLYVVVSVGGA